MGACHQPRRTPSCELAWRPAGLQNVPWGGFLPLGEMSGVRHCPLCLSVGPGVVFAVPLCQCGCFEVLCVPWCCLVWGCPPPWVSIPRCPGAPPT